MHSSFLLRLMRKWFNLEWFLGNAESSQNDNTQPGVLMADKLALCYSVFLSSTLLFQILSRIYSQLLTLAAGLPYTCTAYIILLDAFHTSFTTPIINNKRWQSLAVCPCDS